MSLLLVCTGCVLRTEIPFLAFRIDREITEEDRKQERLRAIRAVQMQQAMSTIAVERSRSPRDRT
jgi:hypothetical protein